MFVAGDGRVPVLSRESIDLFRVGGVGAESRGEGAFTIEGGGGGAATDGGAVVEVTAELAVREDTVDDDADADPAVVVAGDEEWDLDMTPEEGSADTGEGDGALMGGVRDVDIGEAVDVSMSTDDLDAGSFLQSNKNTANKMITIKHSDPATMMISSMGNPILGFAGGMRSGVELINQ